MRPTSFIRVLNPFGTLRYVITRLSPQNGNISAIIIYRASNFGPLLFENPVGVTVIRVLGLSDTLKIIISRQSCGGSILMVVEHGVVATHHQGAGPFWHPDY